MNDAYDVVVLGTGAAGLVAALAAAEAGASVGLFEKADAIGGTTALSGGTTWIPVNPHQAAAGIRDSREEALAYLASLSHGLIDPGLAAALVDTGPELIQWLEKTSPVRFGLVPGLPDYHPEHPGGKPGGGRSLDPGLFCFADLGPWADRVVRPDRIPRLMLTETPLGGGDGVAPAPPIEPNVDGGTGADAGTRWSAACSRRCSTGASKRSRPRGRWRCSTAPAACGWSGQAARPR